MLIYPGAYEVGTPNQGIQILREALNERPGVLAERTYSVWPGPEHLMRERGVPQFTVEYQVPSVTQAERAALPSSKPRQPRIPSQPSQHC